MLFWSLATLQHDEQTEIFYLSLADLYIVPQVQLFGPQDISNCLWALTKSRTQHNSMFKALSACAMHSLAHFSPQAMAQVAWSCAKMRASAPGFFNAVMAE